MHVITHAPASERLVEVSIQATSNLVLGARASTVLDVLVEAFGPSGRPCCLRRGQHVCIFGLKRVLNRGGCSGGCRSPNHQVDRIVLTPVHDSIHP